METTNTNNQLLAIFANQVSVARTETAKIETGEFVYK